MTNTVSGIRTFLAEQDRAILASPDLASGTEAFLNGDPFRDLLLTLIEAPAFSRDLGRTFAEAGAVAGLSPCRVLRGSLNLSLGRFFDLLGQLLAAFDDPGDITASGGAWRRFADRIRSSPDLASVRLRTYLTGSLNDPTLTEFYAKLIDRLTDEDPQAIYPTSNYRACDGYVESASDGRTIEAVMSLSTFASIKVVDRSLDVGQPALSDIYRSFDRCVCLVDQNVEACHGREIDAYFKHYRIPLKKLVYRAMEVDKGLATVERMLGDFKSLGVSRNEPVLIIGGGVLADTGGLACALYGRSTPYVMLATSIVTGVDAGPSPRTCCDGFGYKNLVGAYHPPVLCITDRFFFKTLQEGWLRHGIAEIIKMGVVKDAELFRDLEMAQSRLIETRFGTMACAPDDPIQALSQKILGGALRAYVEAEYDNLYETHQCRPHAYGHTWSPGFEIEAGLLHGHAVAVCMGFGAHLSHRAGWISHDDLHRILRLMDGYGLSLWHDILRSKETIWKSQKTVMQKRGQNLVAPLPKGAIGRCGYLNELSQPELYAALDAYEAVCAAYPRAGRGVDPLCEDVGLENPGTVTPGTVMARAS